MKSSPKKKATQPKRSAAPAKTLSTQGLSKAYGGRQVVKDVALKVSQGEIVGLLGPNGAGKTTTFYMVTGLVPPDAGTVTLDAPGQAPQDLTQLPLHERSHRGVGYLAQEASIFRKLTVEENLLALLEMLPISPQERALRLETLLDEFNIAHLAKQKAYTLSGGERRRAEVARALVNKPDFILLDEPFAGVDPIAVLDLQQIIRQLKSRGIGVLITDHNVRETLSIIDRAYLIYQGQVLLSGTAKQLAKDPQARKIYLGAHFKM